MCPKARLPLAIALPALLAFAAPAAAGDPGPAGATLAITDVAVVDVGHGRSRGSRTVLVAGGRIVAIDAPDRARIPAGAQRLDGRGRFLVPGLVDMHVHLFNNFSKRPPNDWAFPLFVAHGVTGVREMSTRPETLAQVARWNAEVAAGTRIAPRVLAAGVVVRGDSPAAAAREVVVAADAGAGFIKVFSDLPPAHLPAIVAAARARSLAVVGHVPAGMAVRDAAASLRNNEHLLQVFEACSPLEDAQLAQRRGLAGEALGELQVAQEARAIAAHSAARCRRVARLLARHRQAQGPTLVLDASPRDGRHAAHPLWPLLRVDEQARWNRILAGLTPDELAAERGRRHVAPRIVAALHRAGVPLLAGTDAPMPEVYPGASLHDELRLLVAAGLAPREALRAATLGAAEFLGIAADTGSIAVGKRADLVLLDADPRRDIGNTRRIEAVVLDGRLLRRADLDALLRPAAVP